jgi:hypothetical protein
MFRIYTGPDGEPAEYSSEENIPFKPKWHFPVSLDGVKEGDFTMIMGFPGSTDRFLNSDGVKLALDVEQPSRVKIRGEKLDIMKEFTWTPTMQRAHQICQQVRADGQLLEVLHRPAEGIEAPACAGPKKAQEDD